MSGRLWRIRPSWTERGTSQVAYGTSQELAECVSLLQNDVHVHGQIMV